MAGKDSLSSLGMDETRVAYNTALWQPMDGFLELMRLEYLYLDF
jgi:hypothetical protein